MSKSRALVDYLKPGFSSLSEAEVPFLRLHRHEVEIGVNEYHPVIAAVGSPVEQLRLWELQGLRRFLPSDLPSPSEAI